MRLAVGIPTGCEPTVVTFTARDLAGKESQCTSTIEFNAEPSALIELPQVAPVVGNPISFKSEFSGGCGPFEVNWFIIGPVAPEFIGNGTGTIRLPKGFPLPGKYTVFVGLKDAKGCNSFHSLEMEAKRLRSGDVNGDETVNTPDLVLLIQVILGHVPLGDVPRVAPSADIDGDGFINIADLIRLIQIISGQA